MLFYLKGNVLVAQPDFQLLSAVLVLLGPFGVVFSASLSECTEAIEPTSQHALHNLTFLHHALDLGYQGMAHAHCLVSVSHDHM